MEMTEAAVKQGLQHIAFTDHHDFAEINGCWRMTSAEYEAFKNEVALARERFPQISITAGIELGLTPTHTEELRTLVRDYKPEFVIGAIHTIENADVSKPEAYEGKTKKQFYREFFETTLEAVKASGGLFDTLAHIDVVMRWARYEDMGLVYEDYAEFIDEVLRYLMRNGKGLEVNAAGFFYGLEHIHPHWDILKRYKELGGEIVTVGSDGHRVGEVARGFGLAEELMKRAGFECYYSFGVRGMGERSSPLRVWKV